MQQQPNAHAGTGYSHATSGAAYRENTTEKSSQKDRILEAMKAMGNSACLKQLEEHLSLPQSTIAGRMADLRHDGKVKDSGELVSYGERRRKRFDLIPDPVPVHALPPGAQGSLALA